MTARLTAEDRHLRSITEENWRATVEDLAERHGWKHYHPPRAGVRRGTRWTASAAGTTTGFPDLTLVKDGSLIFVELKSETGKLSDAQLDWLRELGDTGATTYVWRPSDLPKVMRVLGGAA